jgi:hypothetical protein
MDRQVARSAPVFSHLFTPNFAGKRSRRYWAGSARCRRCQCQATPLLCLCVCAVCLNGFTSLFSLHLLPTCCRRRWDGIEPNLRQGCRFPILGNLLQFNPCSTCVRCTSMHAVPSLCCLPEPDVCTEQNGASRTTAGYVTLVVCRNEFAVPGNENRKRVSQTWS